MDNMTDEEIYGAPFPLIEKLRLLAEWAPLLGRLQAVGSAKTPHDQAVAVVQTLQWAAGKSMTAIDDEALDHIEKVLKTPEGKAFFDWAVGKVLADG